MLSFASNRTEAIQTPQDPRAELHVIEFLAEFEQGGDKVLHRDTSCD